MMYVLYNYSARLASWKMLTLLFMYTTVVEQILSKKKHVILGETMQVKLVKPSVEEDEPVKEDEPEPSVEEDKLYELNKLKVTMSASVPQDHLSLYFGTVLELDDEKDFTLIITDNTCLIIFAEVHTMKGIEFHHHNNY